jgi:ATP-dependent Clp protease ATP-binding subunit ClpC
VFERFTERSKQVIDLAQIEARSLDHNFTGTEHPLLGLLAEPEGMGGQALISLDFGLQSVRAQIAEAVLSNPYVPDNGIPSPRFTSIAKKSLELALRELLEHPRPRDNAMIDTDHLLLGILDTNSGLAVHIISTEVGTTELVRQRAVDMVSGS